MVLTRSNNSMQARKLPAIALNPSNTWGGYFFMSLHTEKNSMPMIGTFFLSLMQL